MLKLRAAAMAFALAGLSAGTITAATTGAAAATAAPVVPTLIQISAAHHPGFDWLVFQFKGGLPAQRSARYVSGMTADPSGLPVSVVGSALLQVTFSPATGHNGQGLVTYGPTQRTYPLPELIQVVKAGDFESVLSFGVGLAKAEPFRMYTLTNPSRVVIDVQAPYRTVAVRDYFLNTHRFAAGKAPYTEAVNRPVIPPATAFWRPAAAVRRADPGRAGPRAEVRQLGSDRVQDPVHPRRGGPGAAHRHTQQRRVHVHHRERDHADAEATPGGALGEDL